MGSATTTKIPNFLNQILFPSMKLMPSTIYAFYNFLRQTSLFLDSCIFAKLMPPIPFKREIFVFGFLYMESDFC